MLHKAWNSKGEVPYCFPWSSIKFQGHTGQNIADFDPNWAFPDYRPVAAFKSLRFALFWLFVVDDVKYFSPIIKPPGCNFSKRFSDIKCVLYIEQILMKFTSYKMFFSWHYLCGCSGALNTRPSALMLLTNTSLFPQYFPFTDEVTLFCSPLPLFPWMKRTCHVWDTEWVFVKWMGVYMIAVIVHYVP